jgi:hypothetical protein
MHSQRDELRDTLLMGFDLGLWLFYVLERTRVSSIAGFVPCFSQA